MAKKKNNLTSADLRKWKDDVIEQINNVVCKEKFGAIEEDIAAFEEITLFDGTEEDEQNINYKFTDLKYLLETARGSEGLGGWIEDWKTDLDAAIEERGKAENIAKEGIDQFRETADKIKKTRTQKKYK